MGAKANNEELARRALTEKRIAEAKMREYRASYEQSKVVTDKLRNKFEDMQKRFEVMQLKRKSLILDDHPAVTNNEIYMPMPDF
jgi:phage shock protein A